MLGALAANILVTTSCDECAALLSEASGWRIVYTRPGGREFARHMAVAAITFARFARDSASLLTT